MGDQPVREDARMNRERLLEAAKQVLAERGLHAEMKEIADRAGVGIGTVYRNFATKEELITAVVEQVLERLRAAMDESLMMDDPAEAIRYLCQSGCMTVEENGELISVLQQAGYRNEEAHRAFVDQARELTRLGVERGTFRSDMPSEFLADFLSAAMPLVYMKVRERWGAEEATRYCQEMFLSALTRS